MFRAVLILLLLILCNPAYAQDCPDYQFDTAAAQPLYQELRDATDQQSANAAMNGLWKLWTRAPDSRAQELLDLGMERIHLSDFDAAISTLGELIEYCPQYAEGYNQRAFAYFLREEYEAALADLERTLEIVPDHVGAFSGKGLTLMGLGRDKEALQSFNEAIALNPWLKERGLLPALKNKLGIEDL